jgi:hypothetical protein
MGTSGGAQNICDAAPPKPIAPVSRSGVFCSVFHCVKMSGFSPERTAMKRTATQPSIRLSLASIRRVTMAELSAVIAGGGAVIATPMSETMKQ